LAKKGVRRDHPFAFARGDYTDPWPPAKPSSANNVTIGAASMVHKVLSTILRHVGWPGADRAAKTTPPFEEWQALNPRGSFKEYYVTSILDALSGKKPHPSLGPLTHEGSRERGEKLAGALIGLGMARSDVVVDYGCGTLRVGKTLIEYLEPSCFVGLDIDHRILDTGRAILPPGLAEEKKPILGVITDEMLDTVALMRPRWIFSKGVIHHVPPADLHEFFANIFRLTSPDTCVLIWARFSDTTTHKASEKTWFHGLADVMAVARSFGLDVEVTEVNTNRVLRLRR
jgi:hypothetical protein